MKRRPTARRLAAAATLLFAAAAGADTVHFDEPSLDRWMYSANSTPGTRGQASVFADPADWNRLAQFMVGFDTSTQIPAGEGAGRYQITSATLTLVTPGQPNFTFDASYDSASSYTGLDPDPGRPLELHGVGYRNDHTGADFLLANTPLSGEGGRNAFPLSWDGQGEERDVSANVAGGFESTPWSVGQVVGVTDGEDVAEERDVRFELDLSDPRVAAYLQAALDRGQLYLMVSSLQPAVQQGGTFVNFFTRDSQEHFFFGGYAPTLEIDYATSAQPAFQIDTVGLAGDTVTFGWRQQAGATYIVESKADGGAWTEERREAATADGEASFSATGLAGAKLFRVRRAGGA